MQTTYLNINAFFIGLATAYYAMMSIQIFFCEKKSNTRLRKILGWIFVCWTVSNAKDLLLTFPGMYTEKNLDIVLVCDGWSALTYLVFLYELTRPGWLTMRHMAVSAMPFALYTVIYIVYPHHVVVCSIVLFLILFGLYITIVGYRHSVVYMKYIRANYSNIDDIDISWIRKVFLLAAASLLTWLFTSLCANIIADCIYYISSVALWQIVVYYSRKLRQIPLNEADNGIKNNGHDEAKSELSAERQYPFAGILEKVVADEEMYLYGNLTLDDLAKRLNTNRTYLSSYFSNVIKKTFYDYINEMRVKEKSIPIMASHPEISLEQIAQQSGFNSLSTFRRAFRKITGKRPGEYRNKFINR